jgi:hypothetical protein
MSSAASKHAEGKRTARRRLVLLGSSALLVAGLLSSLSYLWLWSADDATVAGTTVAGHGTGGGVLASPRGSFTIRGDAAGRISPGVMAPLDLWLTNPHDVPMSVAGLLVTVQGVSAPNADATHPCTVSDFSVDQVSRGLKMTVAARGTSALSSLGLARASLPAVGMLKRSVNQDGCKGASLTLGYAASGTLAP